MILPNSNAYRTRVRTQPNPSYNLIYQEGREDYYFLPPCSTAVLSPTLSMQPVTRNEEGERLCATQKTVTDQGPHFSNYYEHSLADAGRSAIVMPKYKRQV